MVSASPVRSTMSPDRGQDVVYRIISEARARGTTVRTAGRYTGRTIEIEGSVLRNFGGCSYMGLDRRPELTDGAAAALREYGTQLSVSRVYLQCGLYETLEAKLQQMTGRPVLVTPSTTLGHLAALPVLVREGDAVLIDQFAHASLHAATAAVRNAPVRLVRHSRMDRLEEALADLAPRHAHIWLVVDGLYSMFGDFAPFEALSRLLDRWPQLRLYIDDAHGTGWLGTHGRGGALMHLGHRREVVVALSLNKSFAAAGGALAVPDETTKNRIRLCGGPMIFSGPIQPPMLGAAVASTEVHLHPSHAQTQAELLSRIDYALECADAAGVPLATHRTPIFFVPCDSTDEMNDRARALHRDGFWVCPSAFPAVPINRPGIRFTVTMHNEREDIEALVAALARCMAS
jgi:7-keto-8-aminopelargonate synthetase-like enzyme